jgi:NAD(P)-dependent dehydrogenase (short-subunit alcohol dehydrogenase family)
MAITATAVETNINSRRFVGKVAVVTGGNSGIGLATAKAFAREGARVVITGRNDQTLKDAKKELGDDSLAIRLDVTRVADIDAAMQKIQREVGRIDALFVNAGIAVFHPFAEETETAFDATFNTNVKGAYFTVQRALPLLQKGSTVVINASIVAHMAMATSSIYSASKAALVNLGRTLATELIERGIRVNLVSPGPIATPIFDRDGMSAEQKQQTRDWIQGLVPLKRFGRVEEVAEAVLFLATPGESFVYGAELVVDGGLLNLR